MHFLHFFSIVRRHTSYCIVCATLLLTGCASMKPATPPPSLAETDETLATPMRPPSHQKYQWWEFQSLLDPRSRDIERNLGY